MAEAVHYHSRLLSRRQIAVSAASLAFAVPHVVRGQALELRMLFQSSPLAGVDGFVRDLVRQWSDSRGIAAIVDFSGVQDVAARTSRVLRGGEQRDIVELQDFQPLHRPELLRDVTRVAQGNASTQGEYPTWAIEAARLAEVWMAVPTVWSPCALVYRPSMLAALGVDQAPSTWDSLFVLASALVTAGLPPAALPLAQSPVAPVAFANTFTWGYGGQELIPGTNTLGFTTETMHDPLLALQQAWGSGFATDAIRWNDADNLQAFVDGQVSITVASPDALLLMQGAGETDVACAPVPAGPVGRFSLVGTRSLGIPARSPNPDLAMEFLEWWADPEQMTQWVVAYQGSAIPWQSQLLTLPVFSQLQPFLDRAAVPRRQGYAASNARNRSEVAFNYFLLNTFADVAGGADVAEAITTTQRLMSTFYE